MTDTSLRPEVVRVEHVTKRFVVHTENTLKDRVLSLLRRRSTTRAYTALEDVSLSITAGTTVGLLGANGSGKSTLLKMIGGILSPDSGEVLHRGRIAALLELGAGFHPELSGRENVFLNAALLGLTRQETEERFNDIVRFSGIGEFIDNEVKFYSSGMYMRLAFAVAVHTDPDILLVDEVLAVGDEAFQRKCMDKIRSFQQEGRTIILVSHASSQISELCDETFVLNSGTLVYQGDARGGLSAVRDIMEGRRIGESLEQELAESDRLANQPITVTSIETLGSDDQPKTEFAEGDALIIRIRVDVPRPLTEWTTGFSVDTPQGQMVIASNTSLLDQTLPPIASAGEAFMEFRIESIELTPGDYFINANASPKIDVDTSVLWQGARFRVLGDETANLGAVRAAISVA